MARTVPVVPKVQPRTAIAKVAFLSHFAQHGNVLHACREARIGRTTFYGWLKSDPRFAVIYAEATEDAVDVLEAEAKRRAVDGYTEPVYQGGKQVGEVRKFSDNLLITLLKGKRPDVYRERLDVNARLGLAPTELSEILAEGRQRALEAAK